MKRTMAIVATLAAIAIPAAAFGKANVNHTGHLAGVGGSVVKFKESVKSSGSTVTSFAVRNFDVSCSGGVGGSLKVAKLKGKIEVSSSGAFKARDDNGVTVFKVKGQINRNKSIGTFRFKGGIEADDGAVHNCNSGKLSWVTRP
jgi:hypothetical protein